MHGIGGAVEPAIGTCVPWYFAITLHDDLNERLLGFDNAHGVPRQVAHDHQHTFRRTKQILGYVFANADKLLSDFMTAAGDACQREHVEFTFVEKEIELEDEADEGDDDENQADG